MSGKAKNVVRREVAIRNRLGLHARAAAQLVQAIAGLDAEVRVLKDGQEADARSILGLIMLAAAQGSRIEIRAEGPEAEAAVEAIAALVERRFHEEA